METKLCKKCETVRPITDFYLRWDSRNHPRRSLCRWCYASGRSRVMHLLTSKKSHCKKVGIAFELTAEDLKVPSHCPVLGIKLEWGWESGKRGYRDNSPSIDRIDPRGGYTRDNIIIVSFRANRIKNDASVAELKKIAGFYEEIEGEKKRARDFGEMGHRCKANVADLAENALSKVLK